MTAGLSGLAAGQVDLELGGVERVGEQEPWPWSQLLGEEPGEAPGRSMPSARVVIPSTRPSSIRCARSRRLLWESQTAAMKPGDRS